MSTQTTTAAVAENRKFKMHPDLLYSVIRNQAGSIGKAILELVMNSIDAGAHRVDITLDRHSVCVRDDGNGFTEQGQIDDFFETFGTPHTQEEDSRGVVYGRFRMGRGQIFAFAANIWRSGPFQMTVDIQKKGLDYTLDKGLPFVQGCIIDGTLYDALAPSDLIYATNHLREQCRFTPVPVYLNCERINEDVDKVKWTEETEDVYIKIEAKSNRLSIYNLGVLVNHEYTSVNGVGGIVVSKKALEVNFARNDVIKSKCPIWKRIKPVLAKYASEAGKGPKKNKVTNEWRDYMAQRMLAWEGTDTELARELSEAPIFPDVTGKHFSLYRLNRREVEAITLAPEVSLKADRIQQSGVAIALDGEKLETRFNRKSLKSVLERIVKEDKKNAKHPGGDWFGLQADSVLKKLVLFKQLADDLDGEHHIVADKELSKAQLLTIGVIRQVQYNLVPVIRKSLGRKVVERRQVYAMRSETADAFTDGTKNIYIHEKFLAGAQFGPSRAITWAVEVANILVHEYLHDDNNGTGCVHDAEFHELFHQVVSGHNFAESVRFLFEKYADRVKHSSAGIFTRTLDRLAVIEDKVSAAKSATEDAVSAQQAARAENKAKLTRTPRKINAITVLSRVEMEARIRSPIQDVEIVDGFVLTAA